MSEPRSPLDYPFLVEELDPETRQWGVIAMFETKREAITRFEHHDARNAGYYRVKRRGSPEVITSSARSSKV